MRQLLLAVVLVFGVAAPVAAQTGTLAPALPGAFTDNAGHPCNACQLYTYAAGTTTPLSTYSDAALSIANANPIVLDSAGRATIYLSAANYKFILKTAAGATLWTRDNVAAVPGTTVASSFVSVCDGRMTLTSGLAVTTADVGSATTIYYTPYVGNRCALYDGSNWNLTSFTELSLSLGTDATDTNYDLFLYVSGGVPSLERIAWASATVRATSLILQDGVLVKSSDTSRRYLGTYRTASIGQTEDSASRRFVWNYRHRVSRPLRVAESTASWTYTTNTYRQANNAAANQVAVVVGVAEVQVRVNVIAIVANTNTGVHAYVAVGEDSATTPASGQQNTPGTSSIANGYVPLVAQLVKSPAIGYHYYSWLEASVATGTATWYGVSGTTFQAGLSGSIEG